MSRVGWHLQAASLACSGCSRCHCCVIGEAQVPSWTLPRWASSGGTWWGTIKELNVLVNRVLSGEEYCAPGNQKTRIIIIKKWKGLEGWCLFPAWLTVHLCWHTRCLGDHLVRGHPGPSLCSQVSPVATLCPWIVARPVCSDTVVSRAAQWLWECSSTNFGGKLHEQQVFLHYFCLICLWPFKNIYVSVGEMPSCLCVQITCLIMH